MSRMRIFATPPLSSCCSKVVKLLTSPRLRCVDCVAMKTINAMMAAATKKPRTGNLRMRQVYDRGMRGA